MRLHGFKELDRRERAEGSDQHHCVPGLKLMEEGYQGPTGFDLLQALGQRVRHCNLREPYTDLALACFVNSS
jgi:hypothetical protein